LASPVSNKGICLINSAICWNSLVLSGALNRKNSFSYTKPAGNLSLYLLKRGKIQSASETISGTSFNFLAFHQYYITLFGKDAQGIYDN